MIGKISARGHRVAGLIYYLYGPGRNEAHTDPHLVAGWRHPAELEPPLRADGRRDFRNLTGLLQQPHAALGQRGFERPVWHCSVRAAPGDRMLSDHEWAQVARDIMHRTGLAPWGQDDDAVRWIAVRHAPDHIHVVAMLARQDGTRPSFWNDRYRVGEACRAAEERLGLRQTAPRDRTGAPRPPRRPASGSSSPGSTRRASASAGGTAPTTLARSPATRSRSPPTARGPAGRSGTAAGSWHRTLPCPSCVTAGRPAAPPPGSVHRRRARHDLGTRRAGGQPRDRRDPEPRRYRSGRRCRRRLGRCGHSACRRVGTRQPGASPGRRFLCPRRPAPLWAYPPPHRDRYQPPPGSPAAGRRRASPGRSHVRPDCAHSAAGRLDRGRRRYARRAVPRGAAIRRPRGGGTFARCQVRLRRSASPAACEIPEQPGSTRLPVLDT